VTETVAGDVWDRLRRDRKYRDRLSCSGEEPPEPLKRWFCFLGEEMYYKSIKEKEKEAKENGSPSLF
jgi:hypothetical protein